MSGRPRRVELEPRTTFYGDWRPLESRAHLREPHAKTQFRVQSTTGTARTRRTGACRRRMAHVLLLFTDPKLNPTCVQRSKQISTIFVASPSQLRLVTGKDMPGVLSAGLVEIGEHDQGPAGTIGWRRVG